MSELEPGTEESDYDAHSPGRDEYTSVEQEKNPGFLLGAISFVIALLFIIIYFNAGYNSLLLLGAIIFGFAGTLLISSQRGKAKSAATTVPGEQESHQDTEDGLTPFELLVKEALDSIPSEFQGKMDNVLVQVESEPGEELLERTIYQRAIEDYCKHNPERIRKQVRKTVLHEVAHHFGIGHEEMPIWVK